MAAEDPSPIKFPCDFPVKIVGRRQEGFAQAILEIVLRHAPDFDARSMEMRTSSQGAYISLTVTIHARSRDQLDALYRDISACSEVVWAL